MAATAFHAAAQEEKQSSEPTPHTEMWVEPDRIPTPAAPRSGNYPSPARMPVMTLSRLSITNRISCGSGSPEGNGGGKTTMYDWTEGKRELRDKTVEDQRAILAKWVKDVV